VLLAAGLQRLTAASPGAAGPQPDLEPRAQFCGVESVVFTAAMRAHLLPAAPLLQRSLFFSRLLVFSSRLWMSSSSLSLSLSPSSFLLSRELNEHRGQIKAAVAAVLAAASAVCVIMYTMSIMESMHSMNVMMNDSLMNSMMKIEMKMERQRDNGREK
jgi:hypothetical protein